MTLDDEPEVQTDTEILRLRREGYKIWRITELANASENDVMEILVDAGVYPLNAAGIIPANERNNERKPTRETTKERLARMREHRRKVNQARRTGGGNWSGR